jgi:hypothetical protein
MKKNNDYRQIINILDDITKSDPSCNLGKHISIALDGHNIWGTSDKSFLEALKKYKIEIESNVSNKDIEDIIKQGLDLNHILDDYED